MGASGEEIGYVWSPLFTVTLGLPQGQLGFPTVTLQDLVVSALLSILKRCMCPELVWAACARASWPVWAVHWWFGGAWLFASW